MASAATVRVRAYVPSTVGAVAGLVEAGLLRTGGLGFAVTDAQRADDPDADVDEWEFRAFLDAAEASLALLSIAAAAAATADADPVPRRVVVSVDVDPTAVVAAAGAGVSAVALPGEVSRSEVASVHVDGVEAAEHVGRALAGGPIGALDDLALEWFDPSELSALLD